MAKRGSFLPSRGAVMECQEEFARRMICRYGAELRARLRTMLSDPMDVEDVWIQSMAIGIRKRSQLKTAECERAYLIRVAVNLAIRYSRRRQREATRRALACELGDKWDGMCASKSEPQGIEETTHLSELLSRLTPRERFVVVGGAVVGYDDDEIARALQIGPSSVRSLRTRARTKLRAGWERSAA